MSKIENRLNNKKRSKESAKNSHDMENGNNEEQFITTMTEWAQKDNGSEKIITKA